MAAKPETAVRRIVDKIRASFGSASALIMSEGGSRSEVTEVIATGIEVLDHHVIGCGGLAAGKLHELFGGEGAGKSALTYAFLAAAQREGGVAALVETEEALSVERAKVFGIDLDQLALIQPEHMEQALEQMAAAMHAIPTGVGPNLLCWDSIAATPTKKEAEDGMEAGAEMGERARMLSRACRVLMPLAAKKRTALLFVNQVRQKIGVLYGDNETTPGGNAVKFHASFRLMLSTGKSIKDGDKHVGKYVNAYARKNRFAEPHRKAELRLDFADGWNDGWSTLNHAKDKKLVPDSYSTRSDKQIAEAREKLGWGASAGKEIP